MKNYLLLFIVLLVFGCKSRQVVLDKSKSMIPDSPYIANIHKIKGLSPQEICDYSISFQFEYTRPIEGYKVKGKLLAYTAMTGAAIEGPCSLFFYNHKLGKGYHIYSEDYIDDFQPAIHGGKDSLYQWIFNPYNIPCKNGYLQFKYHATSPKEFASPFFFEDVDFDGRKEILIRRTSPLRPCVHYYEVFKLIGKDSSVQLTYQPFVGFYCDRGGTEIVNHENNTITGYWGDNTVLIYHFDRPENSDQFNYPCQVDTITKW